MSRDLRRPIRKTSQDNYAEIDAVLRRVENDWAFMLSEDFDPVTLALALLDESSVGLSKDYNSFQKTLRGLDSVLHAIANDYYQGFNGSISAFTSVSSRLSDSQNRISMLKEELLKSKGILLSKRSDLLPLWHRSLQYKEMIRILDEIEGLKAIPVKLEKLFQEKHYLAAAQTLMGALNTIHKSEMKQIGALDDLRSYLDAQKASVHEILVEELHNHIYLKSPYCENRWSKYLPENEEGTNYLPKIKTSTSDTTLANILNDEDDMVIDDLERNPETDSLYYIEILVEALGLLGKLPEALEVIQQRLPVEIYQLVDKTITDVEERSAVYMNQSESYVSTRDALEQYSLQASESEEEQSILRGFMWSLYSKLEAVLAGHQAIIHVALKINKQIFKLMDSSRTSSEQVYTPISQEISQRLRESAPKAALAMDKQGVVFSSSVIDKFADLQITTGHRLVVRPWVFNAMALLKPTLSFLDRVRDMVPSGPSEALAEVTGFLDEFVLNVFLPQFEDKVLQLFHQCTNVESDTFQEDSNVKLSERPLAKDNDLETLYALNDKEIMLELDLKGQKALSPTVLILNTKQLAALGSLYYSIQWFVGEQGKIIQRDATNDLDVDFLDAYQSDEEVDNSQIVQQKTFDEYNGDKERHFLPLSAEISNHFEEILTNYKQLAQTCLFTLRIELRCQIIYYIDLIVRQGNYNLEDETTEPDPNVTILNSILVSWDESMNLTLPDKARQFIFDGLPGLFNRLLILGAESIPYLNKHGVQKMTRNIMALQQNLTNIIQPTREITLSHSKTYYEMFNLGPQGMLSLIRESKAYSREEYTTMLRLMYDMNADTGADGFSPIRSSGGSTSSSKHMYRDQLMELNQLFS
ncbi:uncharacterized protein VTP21DRAFT_2374 [Calcarisporiella thermophila]|uniref:uncharacterized protein n=1 Tax=Calcarisporiella thermophila TaxID=911321 RepID=UPI003743E268